MDNTQAHILDYDIKEDFFWKSLDVSLFVVRLITIMKIQTTKLYIKPKSNLTLLQILSVSLNTFLFCLSYISLNAFIFDMVSLLLYSFS